MLNTIIVTGVILVVIAGSMILTGLLLKKKCIGKLSIEFVLCKVLSLKINVDKKNPTVSHRHK